MENKIMTLGVFAHANAGKTTITEQLLVYTGVKNKTGRVDHGNTTTDNLKIEQDRGISVRACMVTLPIGDRTVQLIDTPGHVDFSAEVERAINVLDGAVLVVSGVEGVEPQTQVIWKQLQDKKIPTIIFINKMDRVGADFDNTLSDLRSKLGKKIIPLLRVKQNDGKLEYLDVDYDKYLEQLSYVDEEIMDKYINDKDIDPKWLDERTTQLSRSGDVVFVYGGSALLNTGMLKLIEGIEKYLPTSPTKQSDELSGYVYTVKRENNARELYIKVMDGTLYNRQEFVDEFGNKQRIRTLTKIKGSKREKADTIKTGEIGIVTGLSTKCGEFIGEVKKDFKITSFVNPLFHTTVSIDDESKINELASALQILDDEDPSLHLKYNRLTGQMSIDLMGPLQSEVITNLLQERFGLQIKISDPIIIQKETPKKLGVGQASFDRVSEVKFEVEPLPVGSGLQYECLVSTDYLFAKYQKQIERLINLYSKQGLYGWEVTDCKITLTEGKSDSVCSEPSHYNVIVPLSLMRSFKDAGMQLLEPVMNYTLTIPEEYFKNVISMTSSIGIDYEKIEKVNGNYIIPGSGPLREIVDLPIFITRVTSGHGSMIEEPAGYCLRNDNTIIDRTYVGPDPRNETIFLMDMNSSGEHIDRKPKRR